VRRGDETPFVIPAKAGIQRSASGSPVLAPGVRRGDETPFVIPAKAGIQRSASGSTVLAPGMRRGDGRATWHESLD